MKTLCGVQLALLFSFGISTAAFAADSLLKKATFCHELDKDTQEPKDVAEFFYPDEAVHLAVELKGRPTKGSTTAKFLFRGELIAETTIDVAEVNKGVLFSIGQSTFAGFTLSPKGPLPLGDNYTAEVSFDGKPLGTFPFRVAPPKDAIPSKVQSTTLSRGVDEHHAPQEETHSFTSLEKVYLTGRADLGLRTWVEANWYVAGKIDPAGTKSITLEENKKDVPFFFSFIPEEGWPAGEHAVALLMNGKEIARQTFTVTVDSPDAGKKITVSKATLFHDDGNGEAGEETEAFQPGDLILHVEFALAKPALANGTSIVWTLVKAEGAEPQEIAAASIQEGGLQKVITGRLTTKKRLPKGSYRVDLMKGDTVLATKEFKMGDETFLSDKVGGTLKKKTK